MKTASQFAPERLGARRWHQGAGACEAQPAISNPPRFEGKPSVERNNDWLATRAAALNLRRLINLGLDRTDTTWTIAG